MPDREDLLRERTCKGDIDELKRRVFYTLMYSGEDKPKRRLAGLRPTA